MWRITKLDGGKFCCCLITNQENIFPRILIKVINHITSTVDRASPTPPVFWKKSKSRCYNANKFSGKKEKGKFSSAVYWFLQELAGVLETWWWKSAKAFWAVWDVETVDVEANDSLCSKQRLCLLKSTGLQIMLINEHGPPPRMYGAAQFQFQQQTRGLEHPWILLGFLSALVPSHQAWVDTWKRFGFTLKAARKGEKFSSRSLETSKRQPRNGGKRFFFVKRFIINIHAPKRWKEIWFDSVARWSNNLKIHRLHEQRQRQQHDGWL